jgi:transcriptional regulator with XRE-family HTH domain
MRCFKNIAQLIRTRRLQHPKAYSQSELSHLLGYKNGQFISNVERALCNVPLKMLSRVSEVLDIPPQELKMAILKDHEETLNNYLKLETNAEVKSIRGGNGESTSTGTAASNTGEFANATFKMSSNS